MKKTKRFPVNIMYETEINGKTYCVQVRGRDRQSENECTNEKKGALEERNRGIVFLCLSPVRNRRPHPLCCDKMGYQQ